jgi:DNA replication and repair protein RecF
MILERLKLKDFRSYSKKLIEFSSNSTLIIGKNTAGKTNIIEAIWMLALGKSFRADQDREVISWDKELSVLHGDVSGDGDVTSLDLFITHGVIQGQKAPMKKYTVNGISRRQGDFIGNLRVVMFWPEHLELITDSPSVRRRYLDSVLLQVDSEYRRNLLSYEKGLRQRNSLLGAIQEGKASRSQLIFWDQLLIKAGGYLTEKRMELIHFINNFQFTIYNLHIQYDKSVISESRLEQYKMEEIASGTTLVGPHRDDFIVKKIQNPNSKSQKNEHFVELSKYGSRGAAVGCVMDEAC